MIKYLNYNLNPLSRPPPSVTYTYTYIHGFERKTCLLLLFVFSSDLLYFHRRQRYHSPPHLAHIPHAIQVQLGPALVFFRPLLSVRYYIHNTAPATMSGPPSGERPLDGYVDPKYPSPNGPNDAPVIIYGYVLLLLSHTVCFRCGQH